MRRRTVGAIVGASTLALVTCGYVAADVRDLVPGLLTDSALSTAQDAPEVGPQSAPALVPATAPQGGAVDAGAVRAAWTAVEDAAQEGKWTSWGTVLDAQTGELLLEVGTDTAYTPASVTKVLTAFTALETLDASDTLTTGIAAVGSDLYLHSEGDLLLGEGASDPNAVEGRAGLADLAARAAAALQARGTTTATLHWQPNPFSGESYLAAWDAQGADGFEGHVASMAMDAGRVAPNSYAFVADPAAQVAQVVASALTDAGVSTTLVGEANAPADAADIATIESATVGEQVRWMLHHSDNTVADQYCRLAAAAAGAETSYAGAVSHVRATLEAAGIPTTGMSLGDCSGLSSEDRLSGRTLVTTVLTALNKRGDTADLVRSLPWSGLNGTMTRRMTNTAAWANAQAKTGSLSMVSTLTGIVETSSGRILVYAIGNDAVPDDAAALTRPHLDGFVAALAAL